MFVSQALRDGFGGDLGMEDLARVEVWSVLHGIGMRWTAGEVLNRITFEGYNAESETR